MKIYGDDDVDEGDDGSYYDNDDSDQDDDNNFNVDGGECDKV